ncbi:hypothetical protein PWT90_07614 [Aphanocladium album]|nr:hypothetical protein PWT90_07614 [Aphanocladium album]
MSEFGWPSEKDATAYSASSIGRAREQAICNQMSHRARAEFKCNWQPCRRGGVSSRGRMMQSHERMQATNYNDGTGGASSIRRKTPVHGFEKALMVRRWTAK